MGENTITVKLSNGETLLIDKSMPLSKQNELFSIAISQMDPGDLTRDETMDIPVPRLHPRVGFGAPKESRDSFTAKKKNVGHAIDIPIEIAAGAAAAAGGTALAGGNPLGAIPAVGAAVPAARKFIADPIKKAMGIKPSPFGWREAANLGAMSAVGQGAGPALGLLGKGTTRAAAFAGRTTTHEVKRLGALYKNAGIDIPSPSALLQSKFLQGIIGLQEKSMFAGGTWYRRAREIERSMLERFNAVTSPSVTAAEAGAGIQRGFKRIVHEFRTEAKKAFNLAENYHPQGFSVSLPGAEKELARLGYAGFDDMANVIADPALRKTAQLIDAAHAAGTGVPYPLIKDFRSMLRQKLRSREIPGSIAEGHVKQMLKMTGYDVENAVKAIPGVGGEAWKAQKAANKWYGKEIEEIKNYWGKLEKKVDPEEFFSAVFLDATSNVGNATKVRKMMERLVPAERESFRELTARRMMLAADNSTFTGWSGFAAKYKKLSPAMKNAVWGNSGHRQFLDDLFELQQESISKFGVPRVSTSPLFTRGELMLPGVGGAAAGGGAVALGMNPLLGVLVAAAYPVGMSSSAKLLSSRKFVQWLVEGSKLKPNGLGAHLGRLEGIIRTERDPGAQSAMLQFVGSLANVGEMGFMMKDKQKNPLGAMSGQGRQ